MGNRFYPVVPLVILLSQAMAWSDGIVLPSVQISSSDVAPTAQKALLWLNANNLELWIDARFKWKAAGGAWVVPLPANPRVEAADPQILDTLDKLSAVRMLTISYHDSSGGGGDGADTGIFCGGGGATMNSKTSDVFVWQSGRLGTMDYAVLGAKNGKSIVKWLSDNGYAMNAKLKQALETEETAGKYFFVARFAHAPKHGSDLGAVRFVFPGDTPPFYPLQLTAAQIPERQALKLLLFVLWPLPYVPVPQPVDHPVVDTNTSYVTPDSMAKGYESNFDPALNARLANYPLLFFYEAALRLKWDYNKDKERIVRACFGRDLLPNEINFLYERWMNSDPDGFYYEEMAMGYRMYDDKEMCSFNGMMLGLPISARGVPYGLIRLRAVVKQGLTHEPGWKFTNFSEIRQSPIHIAVARFPPDVQVSKQRLSDSSPGCTYGLISGRIAWVFVFVFIVLWGMRRGKE